MVTTGPVIGHPTWSLLYFLFCRVISGSTDTILVSDCEARRQKSPQVCYNDRLTPDSHSHETHMCDLGCTLYITDHLDIRWGKQIALR